MRTPGFHLGHWNATCDRCGLVYRNDKLRLEWTGLRVCSGATTSNCWEPRHPQDYVKGKPDRQSPAWVRPRQPGTDVSVGSGNEIRPEDL